MYPFCHILVIYLYSSPINPGFDIHVIPFLSFSHTYPYLPFWPIFTIIYFLSLLP